MGILKLSSDFGLSKRVDFSIIRLGRDVDFLFNVRDNSRPPNPATLRGFLEERR